MTAEYKIPTDVSSVGPKWPPQESSFNRVKGIYDQGIITSDAVLAEVLGTIQGHIQAMSSHSYGGNPEVDRLSVRVLATNECIQNNIALIGNLGEAVIPLVGTNPDFENASILYLGHNLTTRQSDSSDLNRALLNVTDAATREVSRYSKTIERANTQGFKLEVLDSNSKADQLIQNQMIALYKRFGWTSADVIQILSNEGGIIAVAKDGDKIVSAGIAETVLITFKTGQVLRIAEITEAATDEHYQGKGLYSAVAARLMKELDELSDNDNLLGGKIDLAFGECNGNEPGVLKAVKSLGRTFAYEVSKKLNLPFKGYLPQHVPIAGATRATPYNDLFPAFISRNGIKMFVQS